MAQLSRDDTALVGVSAGIAPSMVIWRRPVVAEVGAPL